MDREITKRPKRKEKHISKHFIIAIPMASKNS
jgi:hypothetical protein